MRSFDRLSGLAVVGSASVGPLRLVTPAIAYAEVRTAPSPPDGGLRILPGPPTEPGHRTLALGMASDRFELAWSIPTPEIGGRSGGISGAGTGAYMVHAPVPDEELARLRGERPELIVLANARQLFSEGEPFVLALAALRAQLGRTPVLWAPRVALPNRLAILTYLGVDLVDDTEALWRASQGRFLDPTFGELEPISARAAGICRCSACRAEPPGSLEEHARCSLDDERAVVRLAIERGSLRELVESRLTSEPLLSELLRYADRELGAALESTTPVTSRGSVRYVLAESYRRPEVVRFRQRFLDRYLPPPSKRVLLIVPCSRTKPYRRSRSHRRFAQALEGTPNLERIHVASITSPLGIVPRELEDVYPAAHYDIPVTGEWSEPERDAAVRSLRRILGTGYYESVICHLDHDEYGFLDSHFDGELRPQWTLKDSRSTERGALAALAEAARGATAGLAPVPGGPMAVVREELMALARVQFGESGATRLLAPPIRLAGRPWFQRLHDGAGTDLATWREERGIFQLTSAGGARLLGQTDLEVEIDPSMELTGDLFGPGVASAGESIRSGDAVLLVRGGVLLGVGEATLPGPILRERPRGLAVHVRHRVHDGVRGPADTHLAEEEPPEPGPVV